MIRLLAAYRRLRELGILGMNRRNAAYILDHNPRRLYPVVDEKLRLDALCRRIGVPTPAVRGVVATHSMLERLPDLLAPLEEFVIKPNRGSAGRGIVVVVGRADGGFRRHSGQLIRSEEVRQHVSDILSGMYSLGGRPDAALVQQRVRPHACFASVAPGGVPDVRVVLYRNEPAMAMLRLPTRASGGRANLHQGGIGAGIDLDSGVTHHAVLRNRMVRAHPDTGAPVIGLKVPDWGAILNIARRVAAAVGLGYLGVDVVIDAVDGPLLLEANARPGLAIQIANARGILPRLAEIDARIAVPRPPAACRSAAPLRRGA
jgi:alpha-L-glutamate ligase-like protein